MGAAPIMPEEFFRYAKKVADFLRGSGFSGITLYRQVDGEHHPWMITGQSARGSYRLEVDDANVYLRHVPDFKVRITEFNGRGVEDSLVVAVDEITVR